MRKQVREVMRKLGRSERHSTLGTLKTKMFIARLSTKTLEPATLPKTREGPMNKAKSLFS